MPAAIRLSAFIGEQPRILAPLLPPTAAKAAVNCRLDDGGLTPTHLPLQDGNAAASSDKSIYKFGALWLSWSTVVNVAPGPVAANRLYVTGDGVPKMLVDGTDEYALMVTRPAAAVTATASGSGTGDVVSRVYVYTHVTSFGEESEPSDASDVIDWQPGQTVTLSAFSAVSSGRAITKQRIYRSQTGQSGTYFYLIAERAAGTGDFLDDVAVDAFQEPLPSANYNTPPDGLVGLTSMENGMMAAFQGRDIYFCEPYQPHAWPEVYALSTDADIVALGAIGTSLIVLTKGQHHMVQGTHPSAMAMTKLEQNLSCINARGVVDMGTVIAYPSPEGLVIIAGDGSSRQVTQNLYNRDSWQALAPETLIGGQHGGRYVAFYQTVDAEGHDLTGAVFIDIGNAPYLIRGDAVANAACFDLATGALYYLKDGTDDIMRLDAPDGARQVLYWRSKEFRLGAPDNFGAILIDAEETLTGSEQASIEALIEQTIADNQALIDAGPLGGELNGAPVNFFPLNGDPLVPPPTVGGIVAVGIYADGVKRAQISKTGTVERLPSGFKARTWEIDVAGDISISQITMGRTVDDVRLTAAAV